MRGREIRIRPTTPWASGRTGLVLAILAILFLYYRFAIPFFTLLLYSTYLLWSYSWVLLGSRCVFGQKGEIPHGVFAGDSLNWKFSFHNRCPLPLAWTGISIYLPNSFTYQSDRRIMEEAIPGGEILSARAGQWAPAWKNCLLFRWWLEKGVETNVNLTLIPLDRGVFYLPSPQLSLGDPAGLFRGSWEIGEGQVVYVFPKLKEEEALLPALTFNDSVRKSPVGLEDHYRILGIRDYHGADSLKSINWYASSRIGTLKSNFYQLREAENCLVVLDVSVPGLAPNVYPGDGAGEAGMEEAISYAAGIALYHLEQGTAVAFYTNAPAIAWKKKADLPGGVYQQQLRGINGLDFSPGTRQARRILRLCAAMDGRDRASTWEQKVLWNSFKKISHNSSVYLIRYHTPPAHWELSGEYQDSITGDAPPEDFYSPENLATLDAARVKVLDLSKGRSWL
jgi:hypothetical protein